MDDEGGSSHLSISVIFEEKPYFYHSPLLLTRTGPMADSFRTDRF
jgi:hypothetical protein